MSTAAAALMPTDTKADTGSNTDPDKSTNTKPTKKGKGKPQPSQEGSNMALTAEQFNALPEKMQRRIQANLEKQKAREVGLAIYQSLVKRLIEMGYIESGTEEKIAHISLDSDGNIKLSHKRPKRVIRPKTDEDETDEDTDEDEDEETGEEDEDTEEEDEDEESYAAVLVEALIQYQEDTGYTQAQIARKLKPRGRGKGKQPTQATVSNWLNGKSQPRQVFHRRLERLLAEYLD